METNKVNVFDQTKRKIRCIANEYDYLGDGEVTRKDELEVGKQYTFVKGEVKPYGSMVHLEELPCKYGYQEFLFEELISYDEKILENNYKKWLDDMLRKTEEELKNKKDRYANTISEEEFCRRMEERLRDEQ